MDSGVNMVFEKFGIKFEHLAICLSRAGEGVGSERDCFCLAGLKAAKALISHVQGGFSSTSYLLKKTK